MSDETFEYLIKIVIFLGFLAVMTFCAYGLLIGGKIVSLIMGM